MLTTVIPAYVYQQYADDEDIQAFNASYNNTAQRYVTTFATLGLPVYTGDPINGALLDWVGTGLYGYSRPTLPSGKTQTIGPLNTWEPNRIAINKFRRIGPQEYYVTTDDIYKRCITWHFFKGDGKVFNVRWLKRRVMRFLIGINGTAPPIDNTYQISVTFGVGDQINIRLLNGLRTVTGGAIPNRMALNRVRPNSIQSTIVQYAPLANAAVLKAAIDAGALELPFQFTYVVTV